MNLLKPLRLGIIASLALLACSCGDSGKSKPELPAEIEKAKSEYSIKAFQEVDGVKQLVTFGPGTVSTVDGEGAKSGKERSEGSKKELKGFGQTQQALEREDTINSPERFFGLPIQNVWTLGGMAMRECIRRFEDNTGAKWRNSEKLEVRDRTTLRLNEDDPVDDLPWRSTLEADRPYRYYFRFPRPANQAPIRDFRFPTCDDILEHQEVLLCAADLMAEIADATTTVRWTHMPSEGVPYEFPPQASRDKFVAREMAMNILGHLALFDLEAPEKWVANDPGNRTCNTLYAQYLRGATPDLVQRKIVASVQKLVPRLPENPSPSDHAAVLVSRVEHKLHLLRVAGRLIQELVVDGVRDNISAAEQLRASEGDPVAGLERMWGIRDNEASPYNSLRHALRTLFGRLEGRAGNHTGSSRMSDPQCWGYGALDLIQVENGKGTAPLLGPDFSARWNDRPPESAGQALATSTLKSAGIVVPPSKLEHMGPVIEAVAAQLQLDAAAARGMGLAEFQSTPHSEALTAVLEGLSTVDVRFGLERTFDAYRLLTQTGAERNQLPSQGENGLEPQEQIADSLLALGGVAIKGGLSREGLKTDVMARLAGAQANSQCNDSQFALGPFPTTPFNRENFRAVSLQSPFDAAMVLWTGLESYRAELEEGGHSELLDLANTTSAEFESWVGPGVAIRDVGGQRQFFEVTLRPAALGVDPKQFQNDADSTAEEKIKIEMAKRIAVVHGEAWQVECVIGVRDACPADLSVALLEFERENFDVTSPDRLLPQQDRVTLSTARVPYVPGELKGNLHYYIVAKHDPSRPDGHGRVLAVFQNANADDVRHYQTISSLQGELANEIFGLGRANHRDRTCTDISSAALPANSCIEGVPRNFFVPLANELTSESEDREDSWKHYLGRAKEAALAADERGRAMIEAGKEVELRREGAQEALAQICGEFVDVDSISTDQGSVGESNSSDALNQCLGAQKVDVVFFGKDPFAAEGELGPIHTATDPAEVRKIQAAVCCQFTGDATDNPEGSLCPDGYRQVTTPAHICGAEDLTEVTQITHAGLGLAEPPPQPEGIEVACEAILASAEKLRSGVVDGEAIGKAAGAPFAEPAGLSSAIGQLTMEVLPDGNWKVLRFGTPIMSTTAVPNAEVSQRLYPECCTGGAVEGLSEETGRFLRLFGVPPTATDPGVRWRVERALWYMGALAGNIPAGTFNYPVPVLNRSVVTSPSAVIETMAVYGNSQFQRDNNSQTFRLIPGVGIFDGGQTTAMGPSLAMPAAYAALEAAHGPAWRRALFQSAAAFPNGYLVNQAVSAPFEFDDTLMDSFGGVLSRDTQLAAWLGDFSKQVAGGSCQATSTLRGIAALNSNDLVSEELRNEPKVVQFPRDICPNSKFHVFVEDGISRDLYLRHAIRKDRGHYPINQLAEGLGGKHNNANGEMLLAMPNAGDCNCYPRGTTSSLLNGCVPAGSCIEEFFFEENKIWRKNVANRTRPTACSPGQRVEMFLERQVVNDCDAASALADALALSCFTSGPIPLPRGALPPPIESVRDISLFESWLSQVEVSMREGLSQLAMYEIPAEAVENFTDGRVGTGSSGKGDHGKTMLELGTKMENVHTAWIDFSTALNRLRGTIAIARLELEGADISNRQALLGIAREQIELDRQNAMASLATVLGAVKAGIGLVKAVASGGLAGLDELAGGGLEVAQAQINQNFNNKVQRNLDKSAELEGERNENATSQIIANLGLTTADIFASLSVSSAAIKNNVSDVQISVLSLEQLENQASFQAAKASGADFVEGADGQRLPLFVNTVLNRNYNIERERYRRALAHAKRAAYLARLAMEQRIGVRLADIHEDVGPLEPPSVWAENVCSAQGIDYAKLRTADPDGEGSFGGESDLTSDFADQYIGDYVARLEEFMEFYNVFHPFRQADDTAVLSLRENLLLPDAVCSTESRNLLTYSDALFTQGQVGTNYESRRGWRVQPCDENSTCLQVSPGSELKNADGSSLKPPGDYGAVSWLRTTPGSEMNLSIPEGEDDPEEQEAAVDESRAGVVYQTVPLRQGGRYVLSWWDMARARNGAAWEPADDAPAGTPPPMTPPPMTPLPTPTPDPMGVLPVVVFDEPEPCKQFAVGENVYVKILATDADGIRWARLYLDGVFLRQENVDPYEWSASGQNDPKLRNLSEGVHQLHVLVEDRSGQRSTATMTLTVGNAECVAIPPPDTKPQLSFITPTNCQNSPVGQTVNVEVSATDPDRIDYLTLSVNGQLVRKERDVPYRWGRGDSMLRRLQPGLHTLSVTAVDVLGERTESSLTVSVGDASCFDSGPNVRDGVGGKPPSYRVAVYSADWKLVAMDSFDPPTGGESGDEWGNRQSLEFQAAGEGEYHIAISATEPGVARGSLAIANVQLEEPSPDNLGQSVYVRTEGNLQVQTTDCAPLSPEALRSAFERRCEGGERGSSKAKACYWELQQPFLIDTEGINAGFGGLVGHVAQGNYNFRHLDLAVNVVGTGVLDCSNNPTNSCFGSGYVEYDLEHSAFNVPIDDYLEEVRCFDFGRGAIRSGKGLTAERFITLPVSSEDQGLISQPAFLKPEFSGRPLSGTYRLRIKDNPALVWDRVDDIQVIMNYRYWSRVSRVRGD